MTQLKKIKTGIVNYLNTRPLLYGLKELEKSGVIELAGNYPSEVARMLKNGEIDLGLIPIAAIPDMPSSFIIGNHCIGTNGEIASVALFSEVPMQEIETIYLDYQSRTSVELLKFLMKESWGINPKLVTAKGEDFRSEIKGRTGGLVIGDRAFEQRKQSTFIYDLGSEWRAITGLPFVFAAWVSLQPLSAEFVKIFDEANHRGMAHINEIVAQEAFGLYDLNKYYRMHLSYVFDEPKKEAMNKLIQYISTP
ncbi:MAG: menaquinone biosynthesis protein [Chitinophagaceae bacterium]|nr:menaquinone biosynthesis protein [Chitinophagaceae bacterium]